MSDRPIHDALVRLWDELIEDDKYEMKEVLLWPDQQEAFHGEMREICQEEHYLVNPHQWRDMPIVVPDNASTGYSRHAPIGDEEGNMVGISCRVNPS
jgi:hypothetical protein